MAKIKQLKFGFFNCYLLYGEKGTVLVDTGMSFIKNRLLSIVKNEKITLILLTHGHTDHISNAKYISDNLGGIPIAMTEDDFETIKSMNNNVHTDSLLAKIMSSFLRFFSMFIKFNKFNAIFLKEHDNLQKYGVNCEIIALPGHTKGSIGILTPEKELISGDATINVFYENKSEMLKSVNKAIKTGATLFYPGHGNPQTIADLKNEFNL